jgi:DNA modification methylase
MKDNIPDDYIDLTVTSPPYDNLRTYKGFIFDYQSMLKELYRCTKDGGVVVWVVGDATIKGSETGTSFKQALYAKDIGFNLHDTMIYEKQNPMPINANRYCPCFEYMFVLTKGNLNIFNPLLDKCVQAGNINHLKQRIEDGNQKLATGYGKKVKDYKVRKNIWTYNVSGHNGSKDKITYKHPASFPEQLAEDHINSWSNEGDIVFDPMCGSGTTCKMAYLLHRNFIGIDMSKEYINNICIPRLKKYGWNKDNNINIA